MHLSCGDRLREPGLLAWNRQRWGGLTVAFLYLKGVHKKEGSNSLHRQIVTGRGGNGFKLKQRRFRSKNCFLFDQLGLTWTRTLTQLTMLLHRPL